MEGSFSVCVIKSGAITITSSRQELRPSQTEKKIDRSTFFRTSKDPKAPYVAMELYIENLWKIGCTFYVAHTSASAWLLAGISVIVRLKRAYAGREILSSSDIADRPNEYLVLLAANEYMIILSCDAESAERCAST